MKDQGLYSCVKGLKHYLISHILDFFPKLPWRPPYFSLFLSWERDQGGVAMSDTCFMGMSMILCSFFVVAKFVYHIFDNLKADMKFQLILGLTSLGARIYGVKLGISFQRHWKTELKLEKLSMRNGPNMPLLASLPLTWIPGSDSLQLLCKN